MIETKGLTRHFGETVAVEDLTVHVKKGEVFGFLGPNGAGKTTTIRMLCCLISKTKGEAYIDGLNTSDEKDALKIRQIVGLLPEATGLYERLSAYRNLDFYCKLYGLPKRRREENIERFLRMLNLWERRKEPVAKFSKGMRQKIAIARALIHDPKVVFLDEPTASLDPEASKTVRDFILNLKKEKCTIFLNTHNLDEADRICDRIGIINTKLITVDSPNALKRKLWKPRTAIHLERLNSNLVASVEKLSTVKKVETSKNTIICEVENPEKENPIIVEAIVKAGGKIQYVTSLYRSLEDVYLKLVKETPES